MWSVLTAGARWRLWLESRLSRADKGIDMAKIGILLRRVLDASIFPESEVYEAINELVDMKEELEHYHKVEDEMVDRLVKDFLDAHPGILSANGE